MRGSLPGAQDEIAQVVSAAGRLSDDSSDYDLNPTFRPVGARLRQAAVLVAMRAPRQGGARLLLTKRASHLVHHPGQIAFPGGKVEAEDASIEAAALREAWEEVGLTADNTELLAMAPAHETVTGFCMSPVLARIKAPFRFVAEPGEVEEVFEVPLAHVMNPARYSVQSRQWRGQARAYYTVPWGPYYIWGATARVLYALAVEVSRGRT